MWRPTHRFVDLCMVHRYSGFCLWHSASPSLGFVSCTPNWPVTPWISLFHSRMAQRYEPRVFSLSASRLAVTPITCLYSPSSQSLPPSAFSTRYCVALFRVPLHSVGIMATNTQPALPLVGITPLAGLTTWRMIWWYWKGLPLCYLYTRRVHRSHTYHSCSQLSLVWCCWCILCLG